MTRQPRRFIGWISGSFIRLEIAAAVVVVPGLWLFTTALGWEPLTALVTYFGSRTFFLAFASERYFSDYLDAKYPLSRGMRR